MGRARGIGAEGEDQAHGFLPEPPVPIVWFAGGLIRGTPAYAKMNADFPDSHHKAKACILRSFNNLATPRSITPKSTGLMRRDGTRRIERPSNAIHINIPHHIKSRLARQEQQKDSGRQRRGDKRRGRLLGSRSGNGEASGV